MAECSLPLYLDCPRRVALSAESWSRGTIEMEGGWIVRERGGAEIGCTVVTGIDVVVRSKVTHLEALVATVVIGVAITVASGEQSIKAINICKQKKIMSLPKVPCLL